MTVTDATERPGWVRPAGPGAREFDSASVLIDSRTCRVDGDTARLALDRAGRRYDLSTHGGERLRVAADGVDPGWVDTAPADLLAAFLGSAPERHRPVADG
jgi:hypothetical protein